MKLQFVGDLIFGDQPVKFGYGLDSMHASNHYSVFKSVESLFLQVTTIANFEAVIRPRPEKMTISNWSMCCDESAATAIKEAGIQVVNVANNHTMDYGEDAFKYTVECLKRQNLQVIGLREHPFIILDDGNERCAVIGVSYLKVRHPHPLYFSNPNQEEWDALFCEIREQGVEHVVVYVHWGSEFITLPTENELKISKELTKLPVKAVIGHHSHVLQSFGTINNVPVFFSLGNFVSDYWQKRARISIALKLDLKCDNIHFYKCDCMLDLFGCPKKIGDWQPLEFHEFQERDISTNDIVHAERTRLRKEYMMEFVLHFYKIRNKVAYVNWVVNRLWFILRYGRAEKNNPELVYEKYKS